MHASFYTGYKHALRADADRLRAALRRGDDATGQHIADAIDLRTESRASCNSRVSSGLRTRRPRPCGAEPVFDLGAARSRPQKFTERHRRPPKPYGLLANPPRHFIAPPLSGPRQG